MKRFSSVISLTLNARGVYSIDPVMGCKSGMAISKNGCYNDCYSAKSARLYGYDFAENVNRYFTNTQHLNKIAIQINNNTMPFVRMGSSGDPSEDWSHTLSICEQLQNKIRNQQIDIFGEVKKDKQIVIITKHWNELSDEMLFRLSKLNVCFNTSISAMDGDFLQYRINQYERLKTHCKSLLRLVSFDFDETNADGKQFAKIQTDIFRKYTVIDTVFRSSKSNPLVKNGVIKIKASKFLGKNALISKYNKKTYFGKCGTCLEMCGVNM